MTRRLSSWQVAFVLLALIWGCSFWWIKLGLTFLSPGQVAFVRTALGAVVLLAILAATRGRLPRTRRTWLDLLVVGLLMNAFPATLFAFGELHVSSILAGIINATTPLATLTVVLLAYREEEVSRERIVGLGVGFVGVLVVIGAWEGLGTSDILGIGACLAAVACYGLGYPYTRRHLASLPEGPVSMATGQVVLGALVLVPVALLAPGPGTSPTPDALLAMLGLGALGSGVAYVLSYRIVAAAGSTTASTVTYVAPIVAVVVGSVFLAEALTWHEPVGAAIVLLGVAISQGRLTPRPATPRSAVPAEVEH
ncbi:MAG: DMT family transporter [Chloroflexi bacterium]|jgi:drug/metabolite transporter (DMT)-like permease|nr:DMT family transporter [Chloroflexota bacterium]